MNEPILTEELRKALMSRLRDLEPWMRFDAVHKIVDNCGKLLEDEAQKQQPTIVAAKERLGFLRLPAELRIRIYELSIVPHGREREYAIELDTSLANPETTQLAIHLGPDRGCNSAGFDHSLHHLPRQVDCTFVFHRTGRKTQSWALQPAITRVCRQVRKETLPIYYANEFVADVVDYFNRPSERMNSIDFPLAIRWLKAMGPENRKLLKVISVQGRGSLNYRWVSARRFLAIVQKAGIDDLPEGIVKSFHIEGSINQFGRAETRWIPASEEMEALHSQFGDEPEKI